MTLSEDQVRFYKQTMEMTRQQINDLNVQIEDELAKVKDRLAELQAAKNAAKQIYDGACKMLGVENDLETSESETRETEESEG
jgi:histidinol phosphatase-like enzyme